MSGLFSTFNIAKRGMNVQQRAIDVTSHNISSADTPGFSRQRAKIETSRPQYVPTAGQLGTGSQVSAIERVRDNFLDYQIRGEASVLGQYEVRSDFLYEIESIFNEPSDTGISSLLNKFFDSFQELSKQPNSSNARTIVAQQTESLCNALNATYTKLENLSNNSKELIKSNIINVNSLVGQIDKLNQEIMSVTIAGNTPNDLMDKRDLLIDELSKKMNIVVEKSSFNGVNIRPQDVGKMKVNYLVNSDLNTPSVRLSYVADIRKDEMDLTGTSYKITYYTNGNTESESNKRTITVSDMTEEQAKAIAESRVLWADQNGEMIRGDGSAITEKIGALGSEIMPYQPTTGELNGVMTISKDIQKYMDELNKLAKAIAFSVNAVHSGIQDPFNASGYPSTDYLPFFVNADEAHYDKSGNLYNLYETLGEESKITAKNISINKEILTDVMKIKTKSNDHMFDYTASNTTDGEGDGSRALAIANLRTVLLNVQAINETVINRNDMFDYTKTGNILSSDGMSISNAIGGIKIDGFFKDSIDRLGVQAQEANRMVENQGELLYSLEMNRFSVSGVLLDEEMANLVQFQHSYNANAKVVSTVDELLDVVINGLKR